MDTLLFAPGLGSTEADAYEKTFSIFRQKGYEVRFVPIEWEDTVPEDWEAQALAACEGLHPAHLTMAGFSMGAYTMLLAAVKRPPARLLLLSLSPYFAEDLPYLKERSVRFMGPRRMEAFSEVRFEKIAPRIISDTTLVVGSEETPELTNRVRQAHRQIRRSRVITVEGVQHDMGHPAYQRALTNTL